MENVTSSEIRLTDHDKVNLVTAAKWARFLAIVVFITLGIQVLALIFVLLGMIVAGVNYPGLPAHAVGPIIAAMVFGLALYVVAFLPAFYLFRFAQKALVAVKDGNDEEMSTSIVNLRRFFKFYGVLLVITIVFTLILVAVTIGMGAAGLLGPAHGFPAA